MKGIHGRESARTTLSKSERLHERLLEGDEEAFCDLLDRHAASMLRLAFLHCNSRTVAEEVVQETWLAVIDGLSGFEGGSSLKCWISTILTDKAKARDVRSSRVLPLTAPAGVEDSEDRAAVNADRFLSAPAEQQGHWATPPQRWDGAPERGLLSAQAAEVVRVEIDRLSPMQRVVITMRDIENWESGEVCEALGVSEHDQRVLLHRA